MKILMAAALAASTLAVGAPAMAASCARPAVHRHVAHAPIRRRVAYRRFHAPAPVYTPARVWREPVYENYAPPVVIERPIYYGGPAYGGPVYRGPVYGEGWRRGPDHWRGREWRVFRW
jgi:hypothetical protein